VSFAHDQPTAPVQEFAAYAVRGTLGHSTDVDACRSLTLQVNHLLEQAATHLEPTGEGLACRIGCNFCCHLRVMVLPHEAIALFRFLQSAMPAVIADQVRSRLREYSGPAAPKAASPVPLRRPCAFLVEGKCAAYEVRPSACAAYHSLSKARCEASFANPTAAGGTVALQSLRAVSMALEDSMATELTRQRLSPAPAELHTAVSALLARPGLIARWRAGRPLLNPTASGAP
jgi:Fe-S-cluster containining protein